MIGFIKLIEDVTRTETSLINIVSMIRAPGQSAHQRADSERRSRMR